MGGAEAVAVAERQIGKPYVFGAAPYNGSRVPTAFDCSSLVQYAWATQGVDLPRVTHDQVGSSKLKSIDRKDLQPGDLVFFGWSQPNDHVALYAGDNTIIEAANEKDDIKITKLNDAYWKATTAFRRVKTAGDTTPINTSAGPTGVPKGVFTSGGDDGQSLLGKAGDIWHSGANAVRGAEAAGELALKLLQPSTWVRAGMILAGMLLLLGGVAFVAREAGK